MWRYPVFVLITLLLLTSCVTASIDHSPHVVVLQPTTQTAPPTPTLIPLTATPVLTATPQATASLPEEPAVERVSYKTGVDSYCLWPGDTLITIAQAANVDLVALEAVNPKASLYAGSMLRLPSGSLPPAQWIVPTHAVNERNEPPFGGPGYYMGLDNRQKRVALTFDIGYMPENRDRMVWLHDQGIPATFFVLGVSVSRHPNVVTDVISNGHTLGNHSWDHLNFQDLSEEEIRKELQMTEQVVQAADRSATTVPYFRAPFGAINARVRTIATDLGYHTVGWTIDSQDWVEGATGDSVFSQVTEQVCPGAIIIMHDANMAALPRIIEFLGDNGYAVVPLKDLLGF